MKKEKKTRLFRYEPYGKPSSAIIIPPSIVTYDDDYFNWHPSSPERNKNPQNFRDESYTELSSVTTIIIPIVDDEESNYYNCNRSLQQCNNNHQHQQQRLQQQRLQQQQDDKITRQKDDDFLTARTFGLLDGNKFQKNNTSKRSKMYYLNHQMLIFAVNESLSDELQTRCERSKFYLPRSLWIYICYFIPKRKMKNMASLSKLFRGIVVRINFLIFYFVVRYMVGLSYYRRTLPSIHRIRCTYHL